MPAAGALFSSKQALLVVLTYYKLSEACKPAAGAFVLAKKEILDFALHITGLFKPVSLPQAPSAKGVTLSSDILQAL